MDFVFNKGVRNKYKMHCMAIKLLVKKILETIVKSKSRKQGTSQLKEGATVHWVV